MFSQVTEKIKPLDKVSMDKCQERLDNLIKPINSLGVLESLAVKISGILSCNRPIIKAKLILVLPKEQHDLDYNKNKKTLDLLAEKQGADVVLFQENTIFENYNVICLSDFFEKDIDFENELPEDNEDIMLMTGIILKACERRSLVVIDSVAASIAALAATKIAPEVKDFLFAPCKFNNKTYELALKELELTPCLDLEFEKLNGVGSILFLSIVKMTLNLLNNMKTFKEANVSIAEDGEGILKQNIY